MLGDNRLHQDKEVKKMEQFEELPDEELPEDDGYDIFILTDISEMGYAICFSGDKELRACTVEGLRYDDLIDIIVVTELPESHEAWVELLNHWIAWNE